MHLSVFRAAAWAITAVLACAEAAVAAPDPAIEVTVSGVTYQLSSVKGRYDQNVDLFQSQPWWGDGALAKAVLDKYDESHDSTISGGPFDRYIYNLNSATQVNVWAYLPGSNLKLNTTANLTDSYDYITATTVSDVPEIDGGSAARLAFLFGFGLLALKARRDRAAAEG